MNVAERAFARIDTALKGYLRILPAGRFTPLFNASPTGAAPQLSEAAQDAMPDGLVQYLRSMNEKLNTILTLLTQQSLQEDFPFPILVHDISGAGLRFSSEQEFRLGQDVEAVIALGSQPHSLAGATGTLIREEEHLGQRVWALEFKEMRDSEREKIVQFVVARQREKLRERHLSPAS
jgi:hypothetical protein